eukprot:CAMPEP_0184692772 /NCGR_PEP_ID=MMETSP0313-20130426/1101_1 /TAXON_ID=2792 /ORGANISM="Porphyridium aerugineum, Strain SAG 1380-2" /LENGTH=345 /DNA_ID=CAMNT_0027150621 /DNA_START=72 /DNA_END=1109 /DNA_ORIENTATION=+
MAESGIASDAAFVSAPLSTPCSTVASRTSTCSATKAHTLQRALRCRYLVCSAASSSSATDENSSIKSSVTEATPGFETKALSETDRTKLWEDIALLELTLEAAVKTEQFQEAARLRDRIAMLKNQDPYIQVEAKLKDALKDEKYDEAAKLRDTLDKLTPPPSDMFAGADGNKKKRSAGVTNAGSGAGSMGGDGKKIDLSNIASTCSATTNGINVTVESFYLPEKSKPQINYFIFGYKVKITNVKCPKGMVQLVRRQWNIRSVEGKVSVVKGQGVVGEQPVLDIGESFEYTSMCPIEVSNADASLKGSVLGCMEGTYAMVGGPLGNEFFDVIVPKFGFRLPGDVNW